MQRKSKNSSLAIIRQDPWLEPVQQEIYARYQRFLDRKQGIEQSANSLKNFASAYSYFGIHFNKKENSWIYREWAPAAKGLFLIGDFNKWEYFTHPLQAIGNGVWEIKLPYEEYKDTFTHQSKVKVVVQTEQGTRPRIPIYINRVVQDEFTKDFAGQLWFPTKNYSWKIKKFSLPKDESLLIYECHIGMAQEKEGVGTFHEFTQKILPEVSEKGYNVVQIMALAEHPYYGSFGYHVSNFFAPSSRFGTPEELKELVDKAHELGIAVIMDIVHSHTVKNMNEGLNDFDGSGHQYCHEGDRGNHPAWDSKLFDYGKTEVLQFLLSNIAYWMHEFKMDGFRFDGVTSMLYFHHGLGVDFGDRDGYFSQGVEFDAVSYLQLANELIKEINPRAISIAEDVSGMPGLCSAIREGGIGFDYRLGMGIPDYWIKLLKEKNDEDWNLWELWEQISNRNILSKTIAYSESHDQALVGDKTLAFRLMDKEMYFSMSKTIANPIVDRGIALHKLIRIFTISLGGESYLNFMGNEFGHPEWIDFPREGNNWSYKHAQRLWSLSKRDDLKYIFLSNFDKAMLAFVKNENLLNSLPAQQLWVDDWHKILVFERKNLIFIFNFHPNLSPIDYQFPVLKAGTYKVVFDSDRSVFGGFDRVREDTLYFTKSQNDQTQLSYYSPNRSMQILSRN
ncbi:MAG TPA: 1,4-alpha-glucan-branching enzyme [Bacteroidales bacterium]|nr:1,4-alpha-glucan-branching enzyme [Bacteroidales bacterium]